MPPSSRGGDPTSTHYRQGDANTNTTATHAATYYYTSQLSLLRAIKAYLQPLYTKGAIPRTVFTSIAKSTFNEMVAASTSTTSGGGSGGGGSSRWSDSSMRSLLRVQLSMVMMGGGSIDLQRHDASIVASATDIALHDNSYHHGDIHGDGTGGLIEPPAESRQQGDVGEGRSSSELPLVAVTSVGVGGDKPPNHIGNRRSQSPSQTSSVVTRQLQYPSPPQHHQHQHYPQKESPLHSHTSHHVDTKSAAAVEDTLVTLRAQYQNDNLLNNMERAAVDLQRAVGALRRGGGGDVRTSSSPPSAYPPSTNYVTWRQPMNNNTTTLPPHIIDYGVSTSQRHHRGISPPTVWRQPTTTNIVSNHDVIGGVDADYRIHNVFNHDDDDGGADEVATTSTPPLPSRVLLQHVQQRQGCYLEELQHRHDITTVESAQYLELRGMWVSEVVGGGGMMMSNKNMIMGRSGDDVLSTWRPTSATTVSSLLTHHAPTTTGLVDTPKTTTANSTSTAQGKREVHEDEDNDDEYPRGCRSPSSATIHTRGPSPTNNNEDDGDDNACVIVVDEEEGYEHQVGSDVEGGLPPPPPPPTTPPSPRSMRAAAPLQTTTTISKSTTTTSPPSIRGSIYGGATIGAAGGSYVDPYGMNPLIPINNIPAAPGRATPSRHLQPTQHRHHQPSSSPASKKSSSPPPQNTPPPPPLTKIIEYIRHALQPLYNSGCLPQEDFAAVVRIVSGRLAKRFPGITSSSSSSSSSTSSRRRHNATPTPALRSGGSIVGGSDWWKGIVNDEVEVAWRTLRNDSGGVGKR